jgi:hypothetical protein
MARVTVMRETANCRTSSASLGSFASSRQRPDSMSRLRAE